MNLSAHCDLSSSEDSSYSPGFPHINVSSSRYGLLAGQAHSCLEKREVCVAVLSRVVGSPSDLYQIGVTKVVPIENPILIPLAQPLMGCQQTLSSSSLLPKEGNTACLYLPFALSCLKYEGENFSISDKNQEAGSRMF